MWSIRDILLNAILEQAYVRVHEPEILAKYADKHKQPPKKAPVAVKPRRKKKSSRSQ